MDWKCKILVVYGAVTEFIANAGDFILVFSVHTSMGFTFVNVTQLGYLKANYDRLEEYMIIDPPEEPIIEIYWWK